MQTTKSMYIRLLNAIVVMAITFSVSFTVAKLETRSLPLTSSKTDRKIGEYRADLKAFMKLSKSKDGQLKRNAIFNLCALHDQLVADSRFEEHPTIQGFRVTIARRLKDYSRETAKEKLRLERANAKSGLKQNDGTNSQSDSGGLGPTIDDGFFEEEKTQSDSDDFSEQALLAGAQANYSMGLLSGGPNQMFNYAGGRFAPPWDHGPELVALIENTINPSTWQRNGGQNAIHYFRPLRVLVISANQRTQDDTLLLLQMLRRAQGTQTQVQNYSN